ncbi:MAG: hypothetical protein DRO01_08130 [Thermoproteota archaeon]|nr:MAG: hypothetical protein DRO01_08130 [Candidatus Korarchaeota archaeon]
MIPEREYKSFVYLASPYTHPDPKVREQRYLAVRRITASLMAKGIPVFSPITYSHPLAVLYNLPVEEQYWRFINFRMIEACDCVFVAMLEGWSESKGIAAELEKAKELGKDIYYLKIAEGDTGDGKIEVFNQ